MTTTYDDPRRWWALAALGLAVLTWLRFGGKYVLGPALVAVAAAAVLVFAFPGALGLDSFDSETLDDATREVERVLLGARIRDGLAIPTLAAEGRRQVAGLIADGLVDPRAALAGTLVLTLSGRLLADAVVRRLLED